MQRETKWKLTRRSGRKNWVCRYMLASDSDWTEETTGKSRKRQAETVAKEIVAAAESRGTSKTRGWSEFRARYTTEHLCHVPPKTKEAFNTAANQLERLCSPSTIDDIDEDLLSLFAAKLGEELYPPATLRAYRDHLMMALKWAKQLKIIKKRPDPPGLPSAVGSVRGRPLKREEVERMAMQLRNVVGKENAARWAWNFEGLWRSGFRLGETLVFYWHESDSMHFVENLDGDRPRIVIDASGEKGHQNRTMPMTPEFAAFLRNVPKAQRQGPVFRWPLSRGDSRSVKTIGKRISRCGELAGVIVGKRTKRYRKKDKPPETVDQYASAHGFRKSFGTRWAPMVMPIVLKEMMRHASIETTLNYYVGLEADKVGDILWKAQGAVLGDMLDSLFSSAGEADEIESLKYDK